MLQDDCPRRIFLSFFLVCIEKKMHLQSAIAGSTSYSLRAQRRPLPHSCAVDIVSRRAMKQKIDHITPVLARVQLYVHRRCLGAGPDDLGIVEERTVPYVGRSFHML